jgi:hypothetical protein
MAWAVAASGSQTCTISTTHTLVTQAVGTGGKSYVLTLDVNALASGERLLVEIEARARTSDTTRKAQPSALIVGGYDQKVVDLPFVVRQASNEVVCKITQQNGTGRAIPWALLEA